MLRSLLFILSSSESLGKLRNRGADLKLLKAFVKVCFIGPNVDKSSFGEPEYSTNTAPNHCGLHGHFRSFRCEQSSGDFRWRDSLPQSLIWLQGPAKTLGISLHVTHVYKTITCTIWTLKGGEHVLSRDCDGCFRMNYECKMRFRTVEKGGKVYCPDGTAHLVDKN